jgi:hypothetical protein
MTNSNDLEKLLFMQLERLEDVELCSEKLLEEIELITSLAGVVINEAESSLEVALAATNNLPAPLME